MRASDPGLRLGSGMSVFGSWISILELEARTVRSPDSLQFWMYSLGPGILVESKSHRHGVRDLTGTETLNTHMLDSQNILNRGPKS